MSAIALALNEAGLQVSGSDAHASVTLGSLAAAGITTWVGHDVGGLAGVDVMCWSPAVPRTDVELAWGREHNVTMISRAELFAELARVRRVVGITGTHGKTTTTSMLVAMYAASSQELPGWLVGAPITGIGAGGHWGTGDFLLEVDEAFGTFTQLSPEALGVVNVDEDHLDFYGTMDNLVTAFVAICERTVLPPVLWIDDAGCQTIARKINRPIIAVGQTSASWNVHSVVMTLEGASFVLETENGPLALSIRLLGRHNVANAAVAAVVALKSGLSETAVVQGLGSFAGAPRRFQRLGAWHSAEVYEDFGHIPTEIEATLLAAKEAGFERIGVVFEPHRYTRSELLASAFATAFDDADWVAVTEIYGAGEENTNDISAEVISSPLSQQLGGERVRYVPDVKQLEQCISALPPVDLLIFQGAGPVADIFTSFKGAQR
jgi:UDP-N-acetylmuramate--alanine ligase